MDEIEHTEETAEVDRGGIEEAADDQPNAALLAVYRGLPTSVVTVCEAERLAIWRDTLGHLRKVRAALAPHGRFQAWLVAAGYNPSTVYSRLWRADHPQTKQPIAQRATASLLTAAAAQASAPVPDVDDADTDDDWEDAAAEAHRAAQVAAEARYLKQAAFRDRIAHLPQQHVDALSDQNMRQALDPDLDAEQAMLAEDRVRALAWREQELDANASERERKRDPKSWTREQWQAEWEARKDRARDERWLENYLHTVGEALQGVRPPRAYPSRTIPPAARDRWLGRWLDLREPTRHAEYIADARQMVRELVLLVNALKREAARRATPPTEEDQP